MPGYTVGICNVDMPHLSVGLKEHVDPSLLDCRVIKPPECDRLALSKLDAAGSSGPIPQIVTRGDARVPSLCAHASRPQPCRMPRRAHG